MVNENGYNGKMNVRGERGPSSGPQRPINPALLNAKKKRAPKGYRKFVRFWTKINKLGGEIFKVESGQMGEDRREYTVRVFLRGVPIETASVQEEKDEFAFSDYDENGDYIVVGKVLRVMPQKTYEKIEERYYAIGERTHDWNEADDEWVEKMADWASDLYGAIYEFLLNSGFECDYYKSDEFVGVYKKVKQQ